MKGVLKLVLLVCFLAGVATLDSCKKEDSPETDIKPPGGVTTSGVLAISSNRAVLAGHVADMGGSLWMVRGICYDTKPDPCADTSHLSDYQLRPLIFDVVHNPGSFIVQYSGLLPNTTYYARAYAVNEAGITYGNKLSFLTNPILSDIEGRTYGTVNIGTQVWMTENLKTTKYNDGKAIPLVENHSDWCTLNGPGYYVFLVRRLEDKEWEETLYNWHSVNTAKLCPVGWHIPADTEWLALADYVGLKSHEWDGNLEQTYGYTFDARNTVIRDTINGIKGWRSTSSEGELPPQWWSSISYNSTAWYFTLNTEIDTMRLEYSKKYGLSVRCVKDE